MQLLLSFVPLALISVVEVMLEMAAETIRIVGGKLVASATFALFRMKMKKRKTSIRITLPARSVSGTCTLYF